MIFNKNPKTVWSLFIGAKFNSRKPFELFFPNKYFLKDIMTEIEAWPSKADYILLSDMAYVSYPHHMKYEMNDYPHNWNRFRGQALISRNTGIVHEKTIDLSKRRGTKNLKKLSRSLLNKLNRNRDTKSVNELF